MLRSVGARSALAFMPPMQTEFRNRKFGARGRSSAPCGSPPCSSPTASRPCARRAEQRFKRERACVSRSPGKTRCQCVCVSVEKHCCGLVGRKSAVCAEGGRATRTVRHGCSCWPSSWAAASSGRHAHGRVSERVVRVPRQAVRVGWDVCARRRSGAGEIEERRGSRLEAYASSVHFGGPCHEQSGAVRLDEHADCACGMACGYSAAVRQARSCGLRMVRAHVMVRRCVGRACDRQSGVPAARSTRQA